MATNTEAVVKSVHFILSPLGDDGQGGSLRRQNGIYAEVDHSRFVWRTALGAGGGKGAHFCQAETPSSPCLPRALGQCERRRCIQQGPLEWYLLTIVENAPPEGLGVEHVIWHSSQMQYFFSFVPLKPSLWFSVPQNITSSGF